MDQVNKQNELVPAKSGDGDNASDGRDHDEPYGGFRPGLMSREDISLATERITALMMAGLMKETLGRAVLQGLRLQLDCSRAPASTGPSGAGAEIGSDLASFLAENPEVFSRVSPGLAPEFTEAVLRRLRAEKGR